MVLDIWTGLPRVSAVGTLARPTFMPATRILGKRTSIELNAFDRMVTVALGSKLTTVRLSKSMAPAERVLSVALLVPIRSPTPGDRCAYPASSC